MCVHSLILDLVSANEWKKHIYRSYCVERTIQSNLARLTTGFSRARQRNTYTTIIHWAEFMLREQTSAYARSRKHQKRIFFPLILCALLLLWFLLLKKSQSHLVLGQIHRSVCLMLSSDLSILFRSDYGIIWYFSMNDFLFVAIYFRKHTHNHSVPSKILRSLLL